MFSKKLNQLIDQKNSLLCVGLDTDLKKLPEHFKNSPDAIFRFNREIIHATSEYAVAYKPNIAFYEAMGDDGWRILERTLEIVPDDVIVIADAKRADIGNTSKKYAETFFKRYHFDAVTVAPYMGVDSVLPFLEFSEKGVFVLCLTSNSGSTDFQYLKSDNLHLYEQVAKKVNDWDAGKGNLGLVVGATHPQEMQNVRAQAPDLPFLIPGIGAQGGDLEAAVKFGIDQNKQGALINASRSILYASGEDDFADIAGEEAKKLRDEINQYR